VLSRKNADDALARHVWLDRAHRGREAIDGWDARRYAVRVLVRLGIPGVRVAVFHGWRGVQIASGRDWGRPEGSRWATVSVAPWASREEVALALVALAGRAGEPLLLESLLAQPEPD
jgi:hypothetical protein